MSNLFSSVFATWLNEMVVLTYQKPGFLLQFMMKFVSSIPIEKQFVYGRN